MLYSNVRHMRNHHPTSL